MDYLKITVLMLSVLIVLMITGCGIETIPNLNPPEVLPAPAAGDLYFTFSSTGENGEFYFKGFELYYKFFNKDDPSETDDSNLDGLTVDDLKSKYGFYRINSSTDTVNNPDKPLIPVDLSYRGTIFSVKVDFTPLNNTASPGEPYISSDVLSSNIEEIRRDVQNITPDTTFKRFSDFKDSSDSDITGLDNFDTSSSIDLMLYVASYGFDITIGEIYSRCKYLGTITLDLDYIRNNF